MVNNRMRPSSSVEEVEEHRIWGHFNAMVKHSSDAAFFSFKTLAPPFTSSAMVDNLFDLPVPATLHLPKGVSGSSYHMWLLVTLD